MQNLNVTGRMVARLGRPPVQSGDSGRHEVVFVSH